MGAPVMSRGSLVMIATDHNQAVLIAYRSTFCPGDNIHKEEKEKNNR